MTVVPAAFARAVDAALEATVVCSFSRIGYEVRSRLDRWTDVAELPGTGRRVLVTGANSGLGYATVAGLLRAGADVLFTVRSKAKGDATLQRLQEDLGAGPAARASYDVLDLASFASVRAFARRRHEDGMALHAIVHNAGALFDTREETVDGLERTYQIHVVSPFLLTALLLPRLTETAPARVVTVTSGGMYAEKLVARTVDSPHDYRGTVAYARAKRAQVVLTREWARRFGGRGVAFHAVHPGWALTPGVESSLPGFRKVMGPILRDAEQGAETTTFLTLADDLPTDGRLWHDRRARAAHKVPWTLPDRGEAGELWARVCRDAAIDPQA